MDTSGLLNVIYPPASGRSLTPDQERILRHQHGPAWVLAGPGSGKTEVMTVMVLRLLYVDGDSVQPDRVPPEAIFVTTFTEKAARNLEDRISLYRERIVAADSSLSDIDISRLRIGTLHGLCNDLLQEFRAVNYQNVRLMDELEQSMFVYEHMSIINNQVPGDHAFWSHFEYLFSHREWQSNWRYLPSKWNGTAALIKLFNRIAEDRASSTSMRNAGGQWARCADLYEEYVQHLQNEHRCDFPHLQVKFLDFLATQHGQYFRDGGDDGYPGIQWVLVDEYQDTNLIQEAIYLTLANRAPFNLMVVGDDDQAMYRFRGGSVECMVTFDWACSSYLGIPTSSVGTYPLVDNFRSHSAIVTFCNDYINSFRVMSLPGARVSGKPPMISRGNITGAYPAVGVLSARRMSDVATRFAQTVSGLIANGIVRDPSHCCLLLRSTKETEHNARPYVTALLNEGLVPYNPRNKGFLEQEEVAGLLGTVLAIVDPIGRNVPTAPQNIVDMNNLLRAEFGRLSLTNPQLQNYVNTCITRMAARPGQYLTANLQEIIYYILSLPPFDGWQSDPVRRVRLARVTSLFESFASMPVPNVPNVSRGTLRTSSINLGEIINGWSSSFYYLFIGYLSRQGLDEEEDEDVICPSGMVPVMTMHQAKGLEFPFVFVGHANASPKVSTSHRLETELSAFPANAARTFVRLPEQNRAELDLIRQYFVAYSRAQYALIIMGTNSQLSNGRIPCGPDRSWLRNRTLPL